MAVTYVICLSYSLSFDTLPAMQIPEPGPLPPTHPDPLQVLPGASPGSGMGVYLRLGAAGALSGQVLCLYPGMG